MTYFFWGTVILFVCTIIYYLVFFGLVYYWHETKTTVVIVPLLYTFEFFVIGFLVMSLGVILLQYYPEILNLLLVIAQR